MFTDEHDDSQREAEEQLAEYHDFMARPDKRFLVRFITRAEIDAATPGDDVSVDRAREYLAEIEHGADRGCACCQAHLAGDDVETVIQTTCASPSFRPIEAGSVEAMCFGCVMSNDPLFIAAYSIRSRYPRAEIRCDGVTIGNA